MTKYYENKVNIYLYLHDRTLHFTQRISFIISFAKLLMRRSNTTLSMTTSPVMVLYLLMSERGSETFKSE